MIFKFPLLHEILRQKTSDIYYHSGMQGLKETSHRCDSRGVFYGGRRGIFGISGNLKGMLFLGMSSKGIHRRQPGELIEIVKETATPAA